MRSLRLTAAIALGLAVGWGCGGGSGGPSSPSPSSGSGSPITINIVGERGAQSFNPNPASAAGEMVVFRNNDSVAHRVLLNDASIDTGDIPPGGTSRAVRMPASGTNYHCSLHPTMIGAVNADNQPPPPCTGLYC
jgi:plastocyanin